MRGIVIFLLFFNLIWADTVILKNGSVYEGRIIKETEKMIIIKTEIGEIGIPREKIKEIEYEWIKEGEKEYKKGNWEEAKEIFEKYIEKEKGKTKDKEKAIFKAGMCYIKLNKKEKALKKFLQLLKEYPETEYREKAEIEIGRIYYEKGEKEKAKEIFGKLKGSWDRNTRAEAEYYLFVLNPPETEEAKEKFYNHYITRYPESPYISEILYQKVKTLYNRMGNREKYTIKNIPQYREIKELLEKAKEKTQNPETLKEISPLLITCYDHLAEYRRKHKTMKEYAALLYPEEREKQAEWMKEQADRLITEGETGEAIQIYRKIEKEYPETKVSSDALYEVAKIIDKEETRCEAVRGSIREYENLIKKYPESQYAEYIYFTLVKKYQILGRKEKEIEYFEEFLKKYPESKKRENALFYLGLLYRESKKENQAKRIWRKYLEEYPKGIYSQVIKTYLEGGESE